MAPKAEATRAAAAPSLEGQHSVGADDSPFANQIDLERPQDGPVVGSEPAVHNGWTEVTLEEVQQLSARLLQYRNMHIEADHECRRRSDALTYANIAIAGGQSILAVFAAYTNDKKYGDVSQQLSIVVGVLAAALGILASFQKALNYGERAVRHRYAMHAFSDLNADIECTLVREPATARPQGYDYYRWLRRRFSKISSLAPMPPTNVLKRWLPDLLDTTTDVPDIKRASLQRSSTRGSVGAMHPQGAPTLSGMQSAAAGASIAGPPLPSTRLPAFESGGDHSGDAAGGGTGGGAALRSASRHGVGRRISMARSAM